MILHLIETGGPGGAEQMLLRLAYSYGQKGFSQIVCLRKEGWLANEVRKLDIPLEIIPLGTLPDIVWLKKLKLLVEKRSVVAIHAHEFAMNVQGALLGRWLGIPVVATVHGKGYYGDKWARRQAYRFVSRLAQFVAVSDDIRHHLIRQCGLLPQRVAVIPNGVDTDKFHFNVQNRHAIREQFCIPENQLLLVAIGSYYPVKGHSYLIEAVRQLVDGGHNIKLLLAGQGPLAEEYQKQINAKCMDKHIQVIGYVDDISDLLSALDIFVMPSLSEGLPLALLEAAASKCCIVATDVGGIPEFIVHQKNGILVKPGDADALHESLTKVLDPSIRSILASNAHTTVIDTWSIHRTVERYLNYMCPSRKIS